MALMMVGTMAEEKVERKAVLRGKKKVVLMVARKAVRKVEMTAG